MKKTVILLALLVCATGARAQFVTGQSASSVLGQGNFTTGAVNRIDGAGFNRPFGVAVDASTGKVFVAEQDNHRVLRFASAQAVLTGGVAEAVFGQPDMFSNAPATTASGMSGPMGVAMDASGNLYVADRFNNRVLRFANAATAPSGSNASAVLGQSDFNSAIVATTQSGMNGPAGVAIDASGNLFVADQTNNRVLRFANAATAPSGANASAVLGQATFTSSASATTASGMFLPTAVTVDASGNLYVADQFNHRVLRFANAASASNGANAASVLGQSNFISNAQATTASGMSFPTGVAIDASGNLYVADFFNNRVLRFANAATAPSGASASAALGQVDFNSAIVATTQSGMRNPAGVAIDASGNLYVAEQTNHRVLRFANAASASNGASAVSVLGQGNFTTGFANRLDGAGFDFPFGIATDAATGKVFVADAGNNRVLRFASAQAVLTGGVAEAVFGQPDMFSKAVATTQSGMSFPTGVAIDGAGNLYVADRDNHRVLRFANAATAPSGANATSVLGQANFTSGVAATTQSGMRFPTGVAIDGAGNLYVADRDNRRVLRFANAASTSNGANATAVLGQANFTSNAGALTQSGMNQPTGVAVDASGNLYVADQSYNRVLRFANAATASNGANASAVLGQPTFTSNAPTLTQSGMRNPNGVAIDASGNLYVADNGNTRVLRFANAATASNGANATAVLGQANFTSNILATTQGGMRNPAGVAVDTLGNLYVSDSNNHRVLRFQSNTSSVGEPHTTAPRQFVLEQNYPNPFNPTTVISYQLPVASNVSLKVYDVLGKEVMTLMNGRQEAGQYNASVNASALASGVYFYRLQAGNFVSTKKMMLVK